MDQDKVRKALAPVKRLHDEGVLRETVGQIAELSDALLGTLHMDPETYFRLLKECPDDDLTEKLGVYSNWPIATSAGYDILSRLVYSDESWVKSYDSENESSAYNTILPVQLRMFAGAREMDLEHVAVDFAKKMQTTILLFPHHDSPIQLGQDRSIAQIIEKLGRTMMESGISFCFPESIGWDTPEDYSRIVVYDG